MNKEDVVQIYNGYYSAIKRNKVQSAVETQMILEPVIQCKSEREKQSHINAYIWNLENSTEEPICST